MKQTILVTGGAGFIGSNLIQALVDQADCEVISLDNYSAGSRENHLSGATYIEGATCDIATLVPDAPQLIYHLGEYARTEQSFDRIDTVLTSNVSGTHAVLEYCRKRGSKLVYAGSSTKFADGGLGRDQSPYAWSKAVNTELVANYGRWFDLDYAITYFYNVYGPGERGDDKSGTLIGIFADKYKNKEPLLVYGSGNQKRNFTHVSDIVDGLLKVGERGAGDEYGLGHPDSYSVLDVAKMFGGKIEMRNERPGNRQSSSVDLHRAQLELGWKPTHNLPDYIEEIKKEIHAG